MKKIFLYTTVLLIWSFGSCKKFLDAKSDSALSTIENLDDAQSLLDAFGQVNLGHANSMDNSVDDFFVNQSQYNGFSYTPFIQRIYRWEDSNVFGATSVYGDNDWSALYAIVYRANTVLEKADLLELKPAELTKKDDIKGQSIFLRGYSFLQLVWTFAKSYDTETAAKEPGLPLRLSTDFNQQIGRSSIEATYKQIISDLKNAARLLPEHVASSRPTRPGKAAAYAALARTYLSMRDYASCLAYADSSLTIQNNLLDYNTKDTNATVPFQQFEQPEVLYYGMSVPYVGFFGLVDTVLYQSYSSNDLRRKLFFTADNDEVKFKGSYFPGGFFSGLSTDEVYLMRAECYARTGDIVKAMDDLNTLLQNRILLASFIPLTANNPNDALQLILSERRKELVGRELRWMDIKRLNFEGANINLNRVIDNKRYTLTANSPRFAIPIPEEVISLSGIAQNQY